mmetsp:Transcript_22795/g.63377  ORF Transcript_22795/g.63377 Transcript_22795/m.63377 type:complete len:223 (-) Transcript_22795:4961-5629(-)
MDNVQRTCSSNTPNRLNDNGNINNNSPLTLTTTKQCTRTIQVLRRRLCSRWAKAFTCHHNKTRPPHLLLLYRHKIHISSSRIRHQWEHQQIHKDNRTHPRAPTIKISSFSSSNPRSPPLMQVVRMVPLHSNHLNSMVATGNNSSSRSYNSSSSNNSLISSKVRRPTAWSIFWRSLTRHRLFCAKTKHTTSLLLVLLSSRHLQTACLDLHTPKTIVSPRQATT